MDATTPEQPTPPFTLDTFNSQLKTNLATYKNTWAKGGVHGDKPMGPLHYTAFVKTARTPQVVEADRPEEETLQALLDSTAGGIISAQEIGQGPDAVRKMHETLREFLNHPHLERGLIEKVFVEVLTRLQPTPKKE